jgi:hypothetical protein
MFTSKISVHKKSPLDISCFFFILHLDRICDIKTKHGVTIGCLKSDVGYKIDTNLNKIN